MKGGEGYTELCGILEVKHRFLHLNCNFVFYF